jgi:hypothetical protein
MNTQVTPETLTLPEMASWSGPEMVQQLQRPGMRDAVTALLKNKSLQEVEAAVAGKVVPPVEEQVIVPTVVPPVVPPVVPVPPKRVSIDYQIRDEDGVAIGRPTHLEAATEEELRAKLVEAHTQATRFAHRLKKRLTVQPTPATPPTQTKLSEQELAVALADIKSDDTKKSIEAQAKVSKHQQAEAEETQARARGELASYQFLKRHLHDFNNCEANQNLLTEYIVSNNHAWTLDNLERAFVALESELAPVVETVAPVPPVNPVVPAAPVITTPAAPMVVQPVVTAPAPIVPPANPVAATPRPGVNAGIVPGANSGSRPVTNITPTGLTMAEIHSWDGATLKAKMANPAIRPLIDKAVADYNARKRGVSQ